MIRSLDGQTVRACFRHSIIAHVAIPGGAPRYRNWSRALPRRSPRVPVRPQWLTVRKQDASRPKAQLQRQQRALGADSATRNRHPGCANMRDMNLRHAKQRIVPIGGKPYDFPNPANRSAEISMICSLSRDPEASLTVKFRSRRPKKFLPSDLPSKQFAGGNRFR